MKKDIISYIKDNMKDFSKRQRMVAEYIIHHYDKAAYMTAAKLGAESGVSESTVVRFAAEIGFDGYQQLQRRLQEVTRTKLTSIQRMEMASRRIGDGDILQDVLEADMEKIQNTLQEIDRGEFDKAVTALSSAKRIYIVGTRSSSALAIFASFYLNLIFDNVKLIYTTSASDLFEQLLRVEKGDAVLGISFPRYSNITLTAMEYAKKRGAQVIGLTDSMNSPVVRQSTCSLIARSDMDSFVDSLVAPFSVLNALIAALGMNKRDEISTTFEQLENIWKEYRVYETHE